MKKLWLVISFVLVGCLLLFGARGVEDNSLEARYQAAIRDAVFAEPGEVRTNLTPITESNPDLFWKDGRVLLTTWTKYPDSYPASQTVSANWGEIWVTAAPEIRDFFAENPVPRNALALRIEQLLGMPQSSRNSFFADVWVKPEDLFRPCPDPEIDDTACRTGLPANTDPEYVEWFDGNIISSYFSEREYPWTRLGYTYDWGKPDHEGLSEYVIRKDAEIIVDRVVPTEEYFK
ncbi:MAG: hypothetical protein PHP25_01785 [Candidatus Moranbacteria bacterium]|nr:hypothetical protein [Candidatus Moranbacteria bacterium]